MMNMIESCFLYGFGISIFLYFTAYSLRLIEIFTKYR